MQFIVAGIVAEPMAFYEVPATRMVLDFIVHLFMLALYTVVVFEEQNGPICKAEIALTFHVVVSGCCDQHNGVAVYRKDDKITHIVGQGLEPISSNGWGVHTTPASVCGNIAPRYFHRCVAYTGPFLCRTNKLWNPTEKVWYLTCHPVYGHSLRCMLRYV